MPERDDLEDVGLTDAGTVDHPGDDDIDDDDIDSGPEAGSVAAGADLLGDADHLDGADTSVVGDIGRGDRPEDRVGSSGEADGGRLELDDRVGGVDRDPADSLQDYLEDGREAPPA